MGVKEKKSLKKKGKKGSSSSSSDLLLSNTNEASDFLPLEGGPARKLPKQEESLKDPATVLYIGRIPHGFYENQMEVVPVKFSLEAASRAESNASRGLYDASTVSSQQARALTEDAFFHPSIMSLSYSSSEHYFAIYMPFLAPVSLHVLLAAIKEVKRYKQERKKYMAWLNQEDFLLIEKIFGVEIVSETDPFFSPSIFCEKQKLKIPAKLGYGEQGSPLTIPVFQIARELRLRDIGGIIVVDFIDMVDDGDITVRTIRSARIIFSVTRR